MLMRKRLGMWAAALAAVGGTLTSGAAGAATEVSTATLVAAKPTTASSVAADNPTTAPAPVLHVGQLKPVNEAENIARSMDALTTVPGTDLLVGYQLGAPAGWYQLEGSTLVWHEPSPSDTHRITVTVQDAGDLRVIPNAKVQASFSDTAGKSIGTTQTLNFLWDTDFYHYELNVALPDDTATATLHLRIDPPSFRRHHQVLGAFFAQTARHTFESVKVPKSVKPKPKPGVPTTRGLFSEGRRPYAEPTPYPGTTPTSNRKTTSPK